MTILILSVLGAVLGVIFEVFDLIIDLSEIGIMLYAACLFVFSLRYTKVSRCTVIETIGEKYSLGVYVFHLAVASVVSRIFGILGLRDHGLIMWFSPLIVVALSIFCSIVFYNIKDFVRKSI